MKRIFTKEIFANALGEAINEGEVMVAIMLEALEAAEWGGTKTVADIHYFTKEVDVCPVCRAERGHNQHTPNCTLSKAIEVAKNGIDEETKEKWLRKIREGE